MRPVVIGTPTVIALLALVVAACGSSSSPPSSNEVAPKPVSAETRIDAAVRIDAPARAATADDEAEPACDPDDPRCTAPLESGKNHPRTPKSAGSEEVQ